MSGRLRMLAWPAVIALLAGVLYSARISDEMVDFGVYRTAAVRALSGEPLYRASDEHYQFKYLPAFALGMTPFALMREDVAKAVWFAVSVGLLMALVRWSIFGLPARRRPVRVLTWLTLLFMAKFYAHELTLGQSNILLATLLVGALLAVQIDHRRVAGVLVGLAVFVKPYAALLLPWLAFSHGLTAAALGVGVVVAGLGLPALVYGWTANLGLLADWYRTVSTSTTATLLGNDNISLAAMWAKWIGPGSVAAALAAGTAAGAIGIAIATWQRRLRIDEPDYLEWALLMLLVPLLSPQGWDYVLLLGTPAVVCLLDRWSTLDATWQTIAGVSLALMGLTVFDIMGRQLYGQFMAWSVVTIAALGVVASLAKLRWQAQA